MHKNVGAPLHRRQSREGENPLARSRTQIIRFPHCTDIVEKSVI